MGRLRISPTPHRKAMAWMGEKLAEIKLRLDDPGCGPLHLLEALEAIAIGIEGKRALWRALAAARISGLSPHHPGPFPFAGLHDSFPEPGGRRLDSPSTEGAHELHLSGLRRDGLSASPSFYLLSAVRQKASVRFPTYKAFQEFFSSVRFRTFVRSRATQNTCGRK
jgi:hypothetical protein